MGSNGPIGLGPISRGLGYKPISLKQAHQCFKPVKEIKKGHLLNPIFPRKSWGPRSQASIWCKERERTKEEDEAQCPSEVKWQQSKEASDPYGDSGSSVVAVQQPTASNETFELEHPVGLGSFQLGFSQRNQGTCPSFWFSQKSILLWMLFGCWLQREKWE